MKTGAEVDSVGLAVASGVETAEGGRVAVGTKAVETEEMAGGEGVQAAPMAAGGCKAELAGTGGNRAPAVARVVTVQPRVAGTHRPLV